MKRRPPDAGGAGKATYVYCVAEVPNGSELRRLPRGLPDTGPVRLLDAGDSLSVVVADAPRARFGEAVLEEGLRDIGWVSACAAGHEAVVERVGEHATVVPLKLFTLFDNDERALSHFTRMRRSLARVVARVRGRDEWGVRILFDERRAARTAPRAREPASSGAAFLRQKKSQREEAGRLVGRAQDAGRRAFTRLKRDAEDARTRPPVRAELAGRVVLDAVFLVSRKRQAEFRRAVTAIAKELGGGGYDVALSGPWPAYHFADGAR